MFRWPVRFFFQQIHHRAYLRLLFPLVLALCLLFATVLVVWGLYSGVQGELRDLEARTPYHRQIVLEYDELKKIVSKNTLGDSACRALRPLRQGISAKQNVVPCFPWEKLETKEFSFIRKDAAEAWTTAQSSLSAKEQYRAHPVNSRERAFLNGYGVWKGVEKPRLLSSFEGRTMGQKEWRVFLDDLAAHSTLSVQKDPEKKSPIALQPPPRLHDGKEPVLQIIVTKSFLRDIGYEGETPSWLFLYKESRGTGAVKGEHRIPVWVRAILPYETLPGSEQSLYAVPERLAMILRFWDEIRHQETYPTESLAQNCECQVSWHSYRSTCQPPSKEMKFYCESILEKELERKKCTKKIPDARTLSELDKSCQKNPKNSIDLDLNKPFVNMLLSEPQEQTAKRAEAKTLRPETDPLDAWVFHGKYAKLSRSERRDLQRDSRFTLYFREGIRDGWKRFESAEPWVYAGIRNQSRLREASERLGGFAAWVSVALIFLGGIVTLAAMLRLISIRMRQFGHLKAMGAGLPHFVVIVLFESLLLFALSASLGSAVGLPLGYSLASQISERLRTQSLADEKKEQQKQKQKSQKDSSHPPQQALKKSPTFSSQATSQPTKQPLPVAASIQQARAARSLFDIRSLPKWLSVYLLLLAFSLLAPTIYKQGSSPNTLLKG